MKSVTKKLRESITNNIMLKIAAVFIAALVWLAVVNLSDPTKTITIYGIPINLTDEEAITDQNKVYKVDQRLTLNVTITGKRSVISELSSDDFTAVAPLDEISVANSVQVEVSANKKNVENKISIVNQSVKAVSVDVEDLVDEQYPVEVEITGELAKGYYLGGYSNSRNNIIVTAPESVQHKIDKAKVIVDVSNASQSFEEKYKIKLYDENGNTIKNTNVTKNYNKTKVSIEVLKGNTIPVDVEYSGKPAKGYEVTGVEFQPQKVTLVGKHSLIDSLESIKVPKEDISVDGAKDTVNVEVNLNKYLPDGVSVSDSANAIATITVKVEKLETKKFQIKLIPFVKGSLKFFNNYTNVNLNNLLIVADVYDLGEENLKYGMFIFIELFWNRIKKNRNIKKSIYLDEIWRLIGVTSNKEVASFIYKIFKTIRKYGGSAVAITQDISDLFSLENGIYGKSILNNSEFKTFFALEEENIKVLEQYSNLSEKEKIEIKSLKRGECLMFIGEEHILTKIDAGDFEKEIIESKKINKRKVKKYEKYNLCYWNK